MVPCKDESLTIEKCYTIIQIDYIIHTFITIEKIEKVIFYLPERICSMSSIKIGIECCFNASASMFLFN